MSFAGVSTEVLLVIRGNLLHGIDLVAGHIKSGTFNKVPDTKGACPPSQSGQLTLVLFNAIEIELESRK